MKPAQYQITRGAAPTDAQPIPMRWRIWLLVGIISLLALGTAFMLVPKPPQADPDQLVAEIKLAFRTGQLDRAEASIRAFARLPKAESVSYLLRGELADRRGNPREALDLFARVPENDPQAATARFMAAVVHRKQNRLRAAEQLLRDALRLDPGLVPAHRELIFIYGMQSRGNDLNAQFLALSKLVDLDFREMLLWTLSLEDIWTSDTVREDLERYLAADPDDHASRIALARVLLQAGELDACKQTLHSLPETDVEALAIRARVALNESRFDDLDALLAKGPSQHAALARLRGQSALRRNDPASAIEAFRTALRLEPNSQESIQGLALALRRTGSDHEAAALNLHADRLRALNQLLELCRNERNRSDPTLPLRIAEACEAVGYTTHARGWYRLALGFDPLNHEIQKALHRLRAGQEQG